jgi:hypothetical protein
MRRMLWVSAAALLVLPAAWSRQDQQQSGSQQSQNQQAQQSGSASSQNQNSQGQSQPQSATPQQDSLAAASRKAREQKKEAPKPPKVFTNDDIPTQGGISTVGEQKESGTAQTAGGGAQADASSNGNDEKSWRTKFAKLRHKLDQDQAALDVLQREIGVAQVQYYGGDPTKAMNDGMSQQPFGSEYTKKLADIDAKKKQVEADKQAIADAEDDLHKAGGDPGWAR